MVPPVSKASRKTAGAAKTKTKTIVEPVTLKWDDDMVETLLEQRMDKFAAVFNGTKSKAQIAVYWDKIVVKFNIIHGTSATESQLKSKFSRLKAEFKDLRELEEETGNKRQSKIVYLSYWDTLVGYCGDKRGLRNAFC